MASLHRQPGKPHWFAAFTTPDGKRHFKSTGTNDKKHAKKICDGWQKAAELAAQQNLTADRARKLIDATVSDVIESHLCGTLPRETLRDFFQKSAELVMNSNFARERLDKLIGETVRQVARTAGGDVPHATIRGWCKCWLDLKAVEAETRTHERYESAITHFLDFLGSAADRDLNSLRTDDVIRFRDSAAKRVAVGSVNLELKILRACLYAAAKQDLLQRNVAAQVSVLKERGEAKRRGFTLAEVRKVLAECDKQGGEWRGLVLAALYTGQRLGDVSRLTWQQVDLQKGQISFVTEKTGKRLSMALAKPLREYFESAPSADSPSAFVFPKSAAVAEVRIGTLSNSFYDEILVRAGLVPSRPKHAAKNGGGRAAKREPSRLSFHSFRHSLTTWLKAAGASNAMTQMVIGHDSEVVSRGYTHLGAEDTEQVISKLPDVTKA
jgi:integrase